MKTWVKPGQGFRARIILLLAGTLFGLALLSATVSSILLSERLRDWAQAQLRTVLVQVATTSTALFLTQDRASARATLTSITAHLPGIVSAAFLDLNYRPVAHVGEPPLREVLATLRGSSPMLILDDGRLWHLYQPVSTTASRVEPYEEQLPTEERLGFVYLGWEGGRLRGITWLIFGVTSIVAVALASLLIWWALRVVERLIRPLQSVSDAMDRAAATQYTQPSLPALENAPREIRVIERAFRNMLNAVQERDTQLREHASHLEEEVAERTQALKTARDAAIAASQAKSAFLANMSHELRTPLNSVIVLSDLLSQEDSAAPHTEYAATIKASGVHLLSLIDEILDLAKIEAGQLVLRPREFDISELMASLDTLLSPQASLKGLAWRVDIDPTAPTRVIGDDARLRQVLVNLASNAIKFTDHGTVSAYYKCVHQNDNTVIARFEVHDTGLGIMPADHERIFESFTQSEQHLREEGTGLGLAIARNVVEQMQGRVGVESVPGKGSCFWAEVAFSLAATAAEVRPLAPAIENACSAPLDILVAEDNETNRYVLEQVLRRDGHQVVLVRDGNDALAALNERAFDVALLDHRMPGLSGLEVAKNWSRSRPDSTLPIIILTAEATRELMEACAPYTAAVETKPLMPQRLLATIARHTASPRAPTGTMPSSQRTALLDTSELERLRRAVTDPETFFKTAVETFATECADALETMATALDRHDPVAFRDTLHSIKSGVGALGARAFYDALAAYQRCPDGELIKRRTAIMQALNQTFEETLQRLREIAVDAPL